MFSKILELGNDLFDCLKGILDDSRNRVSLGCKFISVHIELMRSFHIGRIACPLDECSSTGSVLKGGDELGSEMNGRFSRLGIDPSMTLEAIVIGAECGEGIECLSSVVKMERKW